MYAFMLFCFFIYFRAIGSSIRCGGRGDCVVYGSWDASIEQSCGSALESCINVFFPRRNTTLKSVIYCFVILLEIYSPANSSMLSISIRTPFIL